MEHLQVPDYQVEDRCNLMRRAASAKAKEVADFQEFAGYDR